MYLQGVSIFFPNRYLHTTLGVKTGKNIEIYTTLHDRQRCNKKKTDRHIEIQKEKQNKKTHKKALKL